MLSVASQCIKITDLQKGKLFSWEVFGRQLAQAAAPGPESVQPVSNTRPPHWAQFNTYTHCWKVSQLGRVWHKRFCSVFAHSHDYSPDVQHVNQEETQCLKFTVIMDCPNYFYTLEFCLNRNKLKSIKHKWWFLDLIQHASYILHHTL